MSNNKNFALSFSHTSSLSTLFNFLLFSEHCTEYVFYAIVYDVAGNQVSSKSASSPLSVTTNIQAVTGVTLDKTSATLNINGTTTIKATAAPSNANNKNINWSTSNSSIVSISSSSTASGTSITLTAKAAGTATITATAADGSGKKATCTVVVTAPWTILTNSSACTGNIVSPASSSNPTILSITQAASGTCETRLIYNNKIAAGSTVVVTYSVERSSNSYYLDVIFWGNGSQLGNKYAGATNSTSYTYTTNTELEGFGVGLSRSSTSTSYWANLKIHSITVNGTKIL